MSTLLIGLVFSLSAHAYIDPECEDTAAGGPPDDYSEEDQQNYLLNFFSGATTFSPLHSPVPYKGGHGSIGLEASVIPPLGCERRLVLNYTKTEDTNKAPILPRPRLLFALPEIGKTTLYGGLGYVPPVTVFGTRNVILSGEFGAGGRWDNGFELGARFHATMLKTVAEIATPFEEDAEAVDDLYLGSTFGLDAMFGYKIKKVTPYLALGFTDVSTFFYIGDDGVVTNNLAPYAGMTGSAGAQWRISKRFDGAAEFYAMPGVIYTGRLRGSVVF